MWRGAGKPGEAAKGAGCRSGQCCIPPPPHGHSSRPPLQDRTTNRFLSYFFGGALLAQMRQMSCKGLSGVTELTDHVALVEPWKGVVRLHS